MDISIDKYKSDSDRPGSFLLVLQTVKGMFTRLIGFFALTKEDQVKAGIYRGGEGRDE